MELEPVWYEYATFDEDGFVNGISPDAPEEIRKVYEKEQREKEEKIKNGIMIER